MERRNTVQKVLVLHAVENLNNHATAEEVYREVAREHPSISRGTVYRNLNILSEEGSILKIELPGGPDHYDHKTHRHCHLICEECGRVYDVDTEEMPDLLSMVKDPHGFKITGCSITFKGICAPCMERTI